MKKPSRRRSVSRRRPPEFPPGWDEKRVREVLAYYESQIEEEQVAEHQAAYESAEETMIGVPTALVPAVRKLIRDWRGA